jgi:hypothetical protein
MHHVGFTVLIWNLYLNSCVKYGVTSYLLVSNIHLTSVAVTQNTRFNPLPCFHLTPSVNIVACLQEIRTSKSKSFLLILHWEFSQSIYIEGRMMVLFKYFKPLEFSV